MHQVTYKMIEKKTLFQTSVYEDVDFLNDNQREDIINYTKSIDDKFFMKFRAFKGNFVTTFCLDKRYPLVISLIVTSGHACRTAEKISCILGCSKGSPPNIDIICGYTLSFQVLIESITSLKGITPFRSKSLRLRQPLQATLQAYAMFKSSLLI